MLRGQYVSPLAKRWHIDMVGIGFETRLLDGLRNAPKRLAGKHWRSALHHEHALLAEMMRQSGVENCGVELAQRVVSRVGKINDDEIENLLRGIEPQKCIRIDDMDFRREK